MPRARCALLLSALLVACATPPEPSAPDAFDVVLEPSVLGQSLAQQAAWGDYALARIVAVADLKGARQNPAADDYLIELRARAALADTWRERRAAPDTAADDYLDRLVAIADAGQLEEHVLGAFLKPGWTIPAAELRQIDFAAVKPVSPGDTPTQAMAKPKSGTLWPDVPGSTLPDPMTLHPQRVPCTESLPKLREAIRAWEAERDQLDGAPAAAENGAEFLHLLSFSRSAPPFLTRGATWVSPKPYWLLFVAGFCAIEHEKYETAEQWLESAVAMAPQLDTARMELAHALVSRGKLDRADAILEVTIARSEDRCELARALRKRGYIRFEQRRLDDARIAYQRSLEYDPDSPIARSELALLRQEIEQQGGHPDWYVPPASTTSVTACPGS